MKRDKKILVINYGAPELFSLASYLAKEDILSMYVSRYVNKNRFWENLLSILPFVRSFYLRSIGRRKLPLDLKPNQVHEVAVIADFLFAALTRLSNNWPLPGKLMSNLNFYIMDKINQDALRFSQHADVVVGNIGSSLKAFKGTTGKKVLNYPTANYLYVEQIISEEHKNVPQFAGTWIYSPLHNRYKNIIENECELADLILVGSTFAKKSMELVGISEDKVIVVPYGVDNSMFTPIKESERSKKNTFGVIFSGSISQRKGIFYLLEAYKKFHSSDTTLTLIGNYLGTKEPFLPYADLYTHMPNIPRAMLAEHYTKADVYVFPTLIEGLGLTVLEAMACSIPVITTANGPGDIVRDGLDGFIVPAHDVDAIVEKLKFLKDNPEVRIQMGKNARQRALVFSWENYAVAALSAIQRGEQSHPGLERS